MDATDVRRWIAGFEAAAAADRQVLRNLPVDPTWSIRLSLSMIAAAHRARGGRGSRDPWREAEAERVRATWARLRDLEDPGRLDALERLSKKTGLRP